MPNPVISSVAFVCTAAILCSCATSDLAEPISGFSTAAETATVAIRDYYVNINNFEHDLYVATAVINADEIVDRYPSGEKTPLLGQTLSSGSIKARTDALSLVRIYAANLGKLAASGGPSAFASNVNVLGANLQTLDETFRKLSADRQADDPTAEKYIGPVGTIVATVGKMALEQRRGEALREAVVHGAPAVLTVLDLVEEDMSNAIQPLHTTGELQLLAELVHEYNISRDSWTRERREQAASRIKNVVERYETSIVFQPTSLTQSLREAVSALVAFAESSRSDQDLSTLLAEIELFRNNVTTIVSAIIALRNGR